MHVITVRKNSKSVAIRNHVSNVYKKLHVYDRAQAVLYAIREGLVDVNGFEDA